MARAAACPLSGVVGVATGHWRTKSASISTLRPWSRPRRSNWRRDDPLLQPAVAKHPCVTVTTSFTGAIGNAGVISPGGVSLVGGAINGAIVDSGLISASAKGGVVDGAGLDGRRGPISFVRYRASLARDWTWQGLEAGLRWAF